MTPRQLAFVYRHHVHPAAFRADGVELLAGPRVLVYPYKGPPGRRWLWLLLEGDPMERDMESLIKDGGRSDDYREAVACAVDALLQRTNPRP